MPRHPNLIQTLSKSQTAAQSSPDAAQGSPGRPPRQPGGEPVSSKLRRLLKVEPENSEDLRSAQKAQIAEEEPKGELGAKEATSPLARQAALSRSAVDKVFEDAFGLSSVPARASVKQGLAP